MQENEEYAIYLRKSRLDVELETMGEGETLARHESILTEFAKRAKYRITKIYREVVSGETISERHEMQKLLADVGDGKYTGVLVMDVDRLGRGNQKDQGTIMDAFLWSETKVLTPGKTYDFRNEDDANYFEMGQFMSRQELKRITKRLHVGVIASVNDGQYIGGIIPMGYDQVKVNRKYTLKPNADAGLVNLMYQWCAYEKLTARAIAKRLNAIGVPTSRGVLWSKVTVSYILKNPVYIGKIRWGVNKTVREFDRESLTQRKRKQKQTDENDYILIDGMHPAIIEQELWDAVQARVITDCPSHADKPLVNPLAGILRCGKCGKAMTRRRHTRLCEKYGKEIAYYVHQEDTNTQCWCKSYRAHELIERVVESLKQTLLDCELSLSDEGARKKREAEEASLVKAQSELELTKQSIAKLFDRLEREIITEDEFIERKQVLNERLNEQEAYLAQLGKNRTSTETVEQRKTTLHKAIDALTDNSLSAQEANAILRQFIDHIDYYNDAPRRTMEHKVRLDIFLR